MQCPPPQTRWPATLSRHEPGVVDMPIAIYRDSSSAIAARPMGVEERWDTITDTTTTIGCLRQPGAAADAPGASGRPGQGEGDGPDAATYAARSWSCCANSRCTATR